MRSERDAMRGSACAARGRRGRRAEGGETRILRQKRGDEMRSAKRVRMPHAARRTPRAAQHARASRAKAGDGRKRKEARALVLPSSCVAFRLRSAQSFLKRSSNSSESSWHRQKGGGGITKRRACARKGHATMKVTFA